MPNYDYKCNTHGTFEISIPLADVCYPVTCPDCGEDMTKLIRPAAISFKGGGFYKTDNR